MKRFLAMMLTLMLIISCLAVPALAATPGMDNFRKSEPYTGFSDVPAGHWAAGVVQTCCEYALMNGNPDGSLDPNGTASRAHVAAMVARYCENMMELN